MFPFEVLKLGGVDEITINFCSEISGYLLIYSLFNDVASSSVSVRRMTG
jgi:hypothetical protein